MIRVSPLDDRAAGSPLTILTRPSARLGAWRDGEAVEFAVASAPAAAMALLLFAPGASTPTWRVALDPDTHRDGVVWHVAIAGLPDGCEYLWEVRHAGRAARRRSFEAPVLLLDPYATSLTGRERWGVRRDADPMRVDVWGYRCRVPAATDGVFDWQGDVAPRTPLEHSVIYEAHVRTFTQDASSGVAHPGTYDGLIEKIPYLRALGVTAIELLPLHEFNETENLRTDPTTQARLVNLWGYSTVGFFAPKAAYAVSDAPGAALDEFRAMVRAFHAAGIEVILDVVFNHTAEGSRGGPTLHFRGFDDAVYYMHDPRTGAYVDTTGCGNTVNANHPRVAELILASLRYWVTEMHVDGFRFDLASSLTRGADGEVLADPPLMHAIAGDPVLRDVKLIAEAWDIGLYHVGSFPGYGRWAEWNGRFRDTVRRFVRGAEAQIADLLQRLDGSADLYAARGLSHGHSVNFVACHDGFPLADLVRYDAKDNTRNGEQNRDGENHNESWNCGVEGPSDDAAIEALRARQVRNLLTLLCIAPGAVMLGAGDEMGRTQQGNNNVWCQDNELSWLDWSGSGEHAPLWRFVRDLLALRRAEPLLAPSAAEMAAREVTWRGADGGLAVTTPEARTLVGHVRRRGEGRGAAALVVIAHAHWEPAQVVLPEGAWVRVIDTGRPAPEDIRLDGVAVGAVAALEVMPRSVVVLRAATTGA